MPDLQRIMRIVRGHITGAEGSEANMSKQHISFWIKNSNLKECEINMKSIGCNSRSDYIDKAVEFYNGYIHNKNNEDYAMWIPLNLKKR